MTLDQDGRTRVCYDGDAFRRVLQLQPPAETRARAVLGLTRPECESGTVTERYAFQEWAAQTLEGVALEPLPPLIRNRVRMRRIALWSRLTFARARAGKGLESQAAAAKALGELALVAPAELPEWDSATYAEAAVRAAVARSAVEVGSTSTARLNLERSPKPTGETCLTLVDRASTPPGALVERCTFGVVWPASVRVAPSGRALAVAVQPLEDWRELWVFHLVQGAWIIDVLAPAAEAGLGYVEWAGWTPDGTRLLAARETRVADGFSRSFELLGLDTMAVERKAGRPDDLTPFHRWQSPEWRSQTLALR